MRIVIAGAGEVGGHLAKMLSEENHDITVVDDDVKRLDKIVSFADVSTVVGELTTFSALNEADVKSANLFIAVSPDESCNVMSAALAKKLGAKKTIARIDNDEYLQPENKGLFINMGLDFMFYPEKVAANEVIALLENNTTIEYVNFAGDKLSLVVVKLDTFSPVVDKTLTEAALDRERLYKTVAISRNDSTIIPKSDEYFRERDSIYLITDTKNIDEVAALSGRTGVDVKNVMILGGGKIGERIATALQDKINVKLVEYNSDKAKRLADKLHNTLVINEDGRKSEIMIEEQLGNMDAFVAVTGRSETNILASMLAKRMGVKKVIAEIENIHYIHLAESIGIDTIINKKLITASDIFRFTMNTDVQAIKCLNGCDAEVIEFIAKPDCKATKQKIRELDIPRDSTIGGVVRGERVFVADNDFEIKAYDRVVVFALPSAIQKLGKFFD